MILYDSTTKYSILDLGFNKNLTKDLITQTPPEMRNVFSEGLSSTLMGSQEMGGNISLGHQYITIDPSKDPQVEINKLSALGGGVARLASSRAGVISPQSDLVIPAGVRLQGDVESGSIIDFGNASRSIVINGNDVTLDNITIRNSTAAAVSADGYDNIIVGNVTVSSCNIGFDYANVDQITFENMVISSPSTIGVRFNNCSNAGVRDFAILSPGTYGWHIIDSDSMTFLGFSVVTPGSGGMLISGSDSLSIYSGGIVGASGIGIECSASNTNIHFSDVIVNASASDGIKFTATTDRSFISKCTIINSGGYGINVAAASCDDNNISDIYYTNNTSGNLNDSGTGTQAFVDWTDYSAISTIVGWSSFGTKELSYKRVGNTVFVAFNMDGTSNSVAVTFTLPYTSSNTVTLRGSLGYTNDNAVYLSTGTWNLPKNSNIVTCYPAGASGSWTASGSKVTQAQFFYDI